MIKKVFTVIALCVFIISCNSNERPSTAMDTGRAFIRSIFDGDFKTAEDLLYKDKLNTETFNQYKEYYSRRSAEEKENYKKADYKIHKFLDVDDTTTIINYSNTYMKKPMEIKVIKKNNRWQIDLKYTFSGNLTID